jgi:hypothetical protein
MTAVRGECHGTVQAGKPASDERWDEPKDINTNNSALALAHNTTTAPRRTLAKAVGLA